VLKTSYKRLNNIQKGSFAEAYAKMAFTLEGFEVYTSEYDDRGVDFVVRNNDGESLKRRRFENYVVQLRGSHSSLDNSGITERPPSVG